MSRRFQSAGLWLFAAFLLVFVLRLPDELTKSRIAPPDQHIACTIHRVIDGDTVVCESGERVRLLLIDAPEMGQGEYGSRAQAVLQAMIPPGTDVKLELDVQERDRYGRLLAYIHSPRGLMVNEQMVRQGYAVVAVYPPNVKHVDRMRAAAEDARSEKRGLWETDAFSCRPQDHRQGRC